MEKTSHRSELAVAGDHVTIRGPANSPSIDIRLEIPVVAKGPYKGFNSAVAMSAKLLIMALVTIQVMMPEQCGRILDLLKSATLSTFAGWYVYLLAALVLTCAIVVVLPMSGRIRLGPDESIPEHSTISWLAMMFCAGIGVGTLAFAVSEPVSHFLINPDLLDGQVAPGGRAAVIASMRFVFLHYGLSAWGAYAVVGLALGLACHRNGHPLTIRSGLTPLLGNVWKVPLATSSTSSRSWPLLLASQLRLFLAWSRSVPGFQS